MRIKKLLCFLSVSLAFLSTGAFAQTFELSQNGKTVGDASLTFRPIAAAPAAAHAAGKPAAGKTTAGAAPGSAGGFELTSGAKISMKGLDYSFSQTARLSASYHLRSVDLSGLVNGTAATVNVAKAGQQFTMKIAANGSTTNTPLAFHPETVFMPDFDPGALQVLLKVAAQVNNRDVWALIPKQTGLVSALRISTMADEQGTLDGAPITVHHLSVSGDSDKTEVFSGPDNQLLQAEWTSQAFALVRLGFKLKPPAKPGMPPPSGPANQPAGQPPAASAPPAAPVQQ